MRTAFCLAITTIAVIAACSDPITAPMDMAVDLGPDLSVIVDMAMPDFAGISCGNMTCAAPQVCCVTQAGQSVSTACTTAANCMGGSVTCDGPEDCSTAANACCVNIEFTQGAADAGGSATGGTTCTGTCPFGFSLSGSATTKLCHNDNDCAGYTNSTGFGGTPDKCCSSPSAPGIHFCGFPIMAFGVSVQCP